MRLVVDASIAVKWLVDEERSEAVARLLDSEHEFFAPQLMAAEVGNALRNKVREGNMESSRAASLAASIPDLAISWAKDIELAPDAVRLALALNHPVYDCMYLALAIHTEATLITADIRFVNSLARTEHRDAVVSIDVLALT